MTNFRPHKHNHNNAHAVNGISASRTSSRSRSRSRQNSTQDQNYLLPNRLDALGKRDNSVGRTGSEADSILDLYDRQSTNRSATSVMESAEEEKGDNPGYGQSNEAYWIHRDKLAQIESQELQQLGIHIPPAVLANANKQGQGHGHARKRTQSRDSDSHNRLTNGSVDHTDHHQWAGNRDDRQRVESPGPVNHTWENGELVAFDDPRLPEEIAADPYEDGSASNFYRLPVLRTSSSRIPVLSSAPRSRGNTIASRDDVGSHPKSRRGSESAPRALDSPEPVQTTPPQQSRPSSRQALTSSKSSGKHAATATATRKVSTPANSRKASATQKSKTPGSNNSTPNQRPTTRSGERPQTSALNRPEGDPPWLATMYKPDPRLPPDQQILPTHARKLAQEQWQREGKVPTTYDREFSPLAVHKDSPIPSPSPSPAPAPAPAPPPETPQEPPAPPPERKAKTPEPIARPGTSGTDRYKTMPTVQSASTTTVSASARTRPMTVEEPPVKEKSCGCCIVM